MNATAILTGISVFEKIAPVIEAVGKEIGPIVETEITDGKAIWSGVEKAFTDLKAAFALVKSAVEAAPKVS